MKGNCRLEPKCTEEGMKGSIQSEGDRGVWGSLLGWGRGTWEQAGVLPLPCPVRGQVALITSLPSLTLGKELSPFSQ